MNILITGAGGFVGKRLVKHFAEQGERIFAIVRSKILEMDHHYFDFKNVTVLHIDLTNFDLSILPKHIDVVYTMAQSAHFRRFPEMAEDVLAVNVTSHFRLWQWAVRNGIQKCIHASSGGIYGGKLGKVFQEDDLLAIDSPLGFYLGSKLCSEIIFQSYRDLFKSAVILRPFFIYGPGQRRDMLIARLIDYISNGIPIRLQGENGLHMNPTFLPNAVIGFANAVHLNGFHIINIAGPDILTLREVAEIIGDVIGKKPVFSVESGQPVDYVGNTKKAIEELRMPMTHFEEGIYYTVTQDNLQVR